MKLITLFLSLALCLILAWHFEVGINTTPSLAKGLYRVSENQSIKHGDIVKLCLSDELAEQSNAKLYVTSGSCDNGIKPLLKHIVGLEGDTVTVEGNMVFVKAQDKPTSIAMQIKTIDSAGVKIRSSLKGGRIPKGKAFLYSYHDGSFDSRYFGLVDVANVTRMEELITL